MYCSDPFDFGNLWNFCFAANWSSRLVAGSTLMCSTLRQGHLKTRHQQQLMHVKNWRKPSAKQVQCMLCLMLAAMPSLCAALQNWMHLLCLPPFRMPANVALIKLCVLIKRYSFQGVGRAENTWKTSTFLPRAGAQAPVKHVCCPHTQTQALHQARKWQRKAKLSHVLL